MYLSYGSFNHDPGECSVVITRSARVRGGIVLGFTERWNVQGRLQVLDQGDLAANQALVSAAIVARQNAYNVPNQSLVFYLDSGLPSAHALNVNETSGGVRIARPPEFPVGRGAEYSTFRNFALAAEADFLDSSLDLVAWTESLNFKGGAAQFAYLEPMNGLPQKQWLRQQTTFKVTQHGTATGMFGYPIPPAPIWPAAEHADRREIVYELPQRTGRGAAALYTEYRVRWSYSFESEVPLSGLPTAWPEG